MNLRNRLILKLFFFLTVFCIDQLPAQIYLNLDFEHQNGSYTKTDIWESTAPGLGKINAERIIDTLQKVSGRSSFVIISKSKDNIQKTGGLGVAAYLALPRWDSLFRGKKIKIEGFLKFEPVDDSSYASLFALVANHSNGQFDQKIFDLGKNKIYKNTGWQKYSLEFLYDSTAAYAISGAQIYGVGKLYLDNFSITVNQKKIEDIYPYKEADKKELDWLKKHSIVIKKQKNDAPSFSSFIKYLNPYGIIGIGEFSHGSVEVFQFRNEVIKQLLKQQNVVYVLEAELMDCIAIQEYIDKKTDTSPIQLLKNLKVWPWRQQQMLDLIEYARVNNSSNTHKIFFVGIDMQYFQNSLLTLREMLQQTSIKTDTSFFKPFEKFYANAYYSKPYAVFKDSIDFFDNNFEKLRRLIEQKQREIVQLKDESFYKKAQLATEIILQYNSLSKNELMRDSLMFKNFKYYFKEYSESSKFIVSAHNRHLINEPGKLGHFLKSAYTDNYLIIGTASSSGTYTAFDVDEQKLTNNRLFPPIPGTLEYYLHKAKVEIALFNFNKTKKYPEFLLKPLNFRGISAIVDDTQFEEVHGIINKYNAILFIKETSATILLN